MLRRRQKAGKADESGTHAVPPEGSHELPNRPTLLDVIDILSSPAGRRLVGWLVGLLMSSALLGEKCTPAASAAHVVAVIADTDTDTDTDTHTH